MNNSICLLLTGTIAPVGVPNLTRDNYLDRERDYIKSLEFWTKLNFPIIFVENSNYYSQTIENLLSIENSEYLKFKTSNSYLGKGHGEAEIIQYAFDNSKIIKKSNVVVKVTGRLYVKNINILLSYFMKSDSFLLANFRNNLSFADSRLIIAKKEFYVNYLNQELININENNKIYLEHIFARASLKAIANDYKWNTYNTAIQYVGFSGTGNIQYRNSILYIIKQTIIQKLLAYLLKLSL